MFLILLLVRMTSISAYLNGVSGGPSACQSALVIFFSALFSKNEFMCTCSVALRVVTRNVVCSLSSCACVLRKFAPLPHTKFPMTRSSPASCPGLGWSGGWVWAGWGLARLGWAWLGLGCGGGGVGGRVGDAMG